MARIVCIGEGMVELSVGQESESLRYGGDTLNTAVHLVRLGQEAAFFTALGTEPASLSLCEAWRAEGLDCSLVLSHPTRDAGAYKIATGDNGERQFSYWRDESAAREMFALDAVDAAMAEAERAGLLYFSLISLAILPEAGRRRLLDLAASVRTNGGMVAFDGNYRPVLWQSVSEAVEWRDKAIALADIGMPTWEDEMALFGPCTPRDVAGRWRSLGCGEVVVKLGEQGCLLPDGSVSPPPERLTPLDTSGAGDAFDAGYLAAHLDGAEPREAADVGQRLAAWTIMRRGAIPPQDADYPDASR